MSINNTSQYISIGKIVATHGLKGELVLKHALGKKSVFKGLKTIFVKEKGGSFLPWFVEAAKAKNETETYIKLETIDTPEQAKLLTQKEVWLQEADFKTHAAKSAPISLLGYVLIDGEKELGKVAEIIEQQHQVLCKIYIDKKEVLIPLHEETLVKIDSKNNKLFMALPEGLLDIYLS